MGHFFCLGSLEEYGYFSLSLLRQTIKTNPYHKRIRKGNLPMAGGCGAEPRASQYGGAAPGGVGTVRTAHGTGRCGLHQWFAVYRVLVDTGALRKDDFTSFIELVRQTVPDHAALPTLTQMQRANAFSFKKPLPLWDRYNAPVQGSRFDEYYSIALEVKDILE